jgi:hypothetical protein
MAFYPVVNTSTSLFLSFTGAAANIATTLGTSSNAGTPGTEIWIFTTTQACWIQQGANPTATVGTGSTLVVPNNPIYIDGGMGAKLSVIQDTTAGHASLTRLYLVRA